MQNVVGRPIQDHAGRKRIKEEFANMIITQRAYSANTRVISAADEMLEELVRLR